MSRRLQWALIVITVVMTVVSFYDPPYPSELKLQHAPTVAILLTMGASILWFRLSNVSFVCLTVFLWFHILGARWIYSFVPYDDWAEAFAGVRLRDHFGWRRNHYDRLVHLMSGVLLLPLAAECLQRLGGMRPRGAAIVGVCVVLAVGAVYEILEWQIATLFSPAQAEAYNGQQGDIWDPQKDLSLAWLGGIIAAIALRRYRFGP